MLKIYDKQSKIIRGNGLQICKWPGCDDPSVAKSMCHKHYRDTIKRLKQLG